MKFQVLSVVAVLSVLGLDPLLQTVQAEDQLALDGSPTCRWLELDDTKVYQCAVLPPVSSQIEKRIYTEDLPDPTLPLFKQEAYLESPTAEDNEQIALVEPSQRVSSAKELNQLAPTAAGSETDHAVPIAEFTEKTEDKPVVELAVEISAYAANSSLSEMAIEANDAADQTNPQMTTGGRFLVLGLGPIESDMALLVAQDDMDFAVLKGQQKLSLGVFSSQENAFRRQVSVELLGVEAEIVPMATVNSDSSSIPDSGSWNSEASLDEDLIELVDRASDDMQSDGKIPGLVGLSVDLPTHEPPQAKRVISGYLVASLGSTDVIIEKLELVNESDYSLLRTGPYIHRIALGVYSELDNAIARQNYFLHLGIESEVVARAESVVVRSTLDHKDSEHTEEYQVDQIALF